MNNYLSTLCLSLIFSLFALSYASTTLLLENILNIHASIANTARRMAMEVQQQKKRCYCGYGFETIALSDYHTAEQKRASDLGGKP